MFEMREALKFILVSCVGLASFILGAGLAIILLSYLTKQLGLG